MLLSPAITSLEFSTGKSVRGEQVLDPQSDHLHPSEATADEECPYGMVPPLPCA
jgi:hypothetical protein